MQNKFLLIPLVLSLGLVSGCGTTGQQEVLESLQRLVDAAQAELDFLRSGSDDPAEDVNGEIPEPETAYFLMPIGTFQKSAPNTSSAEPWLVVAGWGYRARASDESTDLFRASIGAYGSHYPTEGEYSYSSSVSGVRTYTNPDFAATWRGKVRAIDSDFQIAEGSATLEFDSDSSTLSGSFTEFNQAEGSPERHDIVWSNINVSGGVFDHVQQRGASASDSISGAFYGDRHEGIAGEFNTGFLEGIYGALRDEMLTEEPGTPEFRLVPRLDAVGNAGVFVVDGANDSYTSASFSEWGFWAQMIRADMVICQAIGCVPDGEETLFKAFLDDAADGSVTMMVEGTRSGTSPASGSAVWTGGVRAYSEGEVDFEGNSVTTYLPVRGVSRLEVDFENVTVDVDFTGFGNGQADMSWSDLDVDSGDFGSGITSIDGSFYGTDHEGAAGTFTRDGLAGVFGAIRFMEDFAEITPVE